MKRALIALVLVGVLAGCGGDDGPDKAGFIAWLNAEIRPADNPVDPEVVDTLFDDFSCSDTSLALYMDRVDDIATAYASIYFACGEDATRERVLDSAADSIVDEMITEFEQYAGG